jgi:hypothetical protein
MSKRRRSDGPRRDRDAHPRDPGRHPGDPDPAPRDRRNGTLLRDVLILVAAFGVGVGVAELFGAANLGVAFGVGQVVFAVVLVVLLSRD